MILWKDWAENRNVQVLTHLEGSSIPDDPEYLSYEMLHELLVTTRYV